MSICRVKFAVKEETKRAVCAIGILAERLDSEMKALEESMERTRFECVLTSDSDTANPYDFVVGTADGVPFLINEALIEAHCTRKSAQRLLKNLKELNIGTSEMTADEQVKAI